MIFYNKHFINNTDIQEVLNTLRFGKLSKGKKLSEFENRLKTFLKVNIVLYYQMEQLHKYCFQKPWVGKKMTISFYHL